MYAKAVKEAPSQQGPIGQIQEPLRLQRAGYQPLQVQHLQCATGRDEAPAETLSHLQGYFPVRTWHWGSLVGP